MQTFYAALPADSNLEKSLAVKNFHSCSQSMDRLMALQHENIATLPKNTTHYSLVQTVSERRNNLAQCLEAKWTSELLWDNFHTIYEFLQSYEML